jgi:hypothetical protein
VFSCPPSTSVDWSSGTEPSSQALVELVSVPFGSLGADEPLVSPDATPLLGVPAVDTLCTCRSGTVQSDSWAEIRKCKRKHASETVVVAFPEEGSADVPVLELPYQSPLSVALRLSGLDAGRVKVAPDNAII